MKSYVLQWYSMTLWIFLLKSQFFRPSKTLSLFKMNWLVLQRKLTHHPMLWNWRWNFEINFKFLLLGNSWCWLYFHEFLSWELRLFFKSSGGSNKILSTFESHPYHRLYRNLLYVLNIPVECFQHNFQNFKKTKNGTQFSSITCFISSS